jgi:uncharacterized membrane protein (TIGR02234 family)
MNARRLYGPSVLAALAMGGLAFFAASRTWAHTTITSEGLASTDLATTGAQAEPLISALAVVGAAGALALLAAGRRLRRLTGLLFAVVGITGLWVAPWPGSSALLDAVERQALESPAYVGPESIGATTSTWWYAVAAFAFAALIVVGAVVMRFCVAWPTMSSKYDAPGGSSGAVAADREPDMWKALDDGEDPTQ